MIEVLQGPKYASGSITKQLEKGEELRGHPFVTCAKLSKTFTFITFLFFRRNKQKKELNFQQVGGLVTKNNCFFVYSELRSTAKAGQFQQTVIREFYYMLFLFQPAITCSKLKIETLKQGVKYDQS